MAENQALKTFIIYARDDKAYKDQLLRHLRPLISSGYLNVWHDGDILPGEDWERKIKANLKTSQIVLVLVSVNCLNSDFIEGQELETAVSQLRDGHTRIVPIIISPCGWRFHKLFVGLQGLPEDMKPVSDWPNPDRAWTNVIESLASIVDETRAEQVETTKKQLESEENKRLAEENAAQEAKLKADQAERERITLEQREREAAEQKRLAQTEQQRLVEVAAQKAEAERIRLEQEAERKRLRQEAKSIGGGTTPTSWIGLGVIGLLALVLFIWKPWETTNPKTAETTTTEQATDLPAFEKAKQSGTVAAWQQFLSQYPNSPRIEEAKTQLNGLQSRVSKLIREANTFIKLEEPELARPKLEEAQTLDPDNKEVTQTLNSLPKKKPRKD
jgi:regulator of protease activity HflC (stomatin/prohibitin superfamily)